MSNKEILGGYWVFSRLTFLSVKNKELGKITGVKTEEAKIVSCKM